MAEPERLSARLRARLLPGADLPALVVALIVAVMGSLYVLSFSIALGDPQPRGVPVGVVGIAPDRVDAAFGGGTTAARAFGSARAAESAIEQQRVFGAVERTAAGDVRLAVSTAAGPSVSRALQQRAGAVGAALGARVAVTDLHPISPRDPSGTVFFYVALAAVLTGFLGTVQTRANASGLHLRGQVGWDAARAVLCGLAIAIMVGPVGHFERVPFLWAWALLSATNWAVSTTYSVFRLLIGQRWALLPTWILFVLVSSPASGGAVSGPLLPAPLAAVGQYLPTGAAVTVLRDVTYFPGALHPLPFVVVAVWSVVPAALFVVGRKVDARRRPGSPD